MARYSIASANAAPSIVAGRASPMDLSGVLSNPETTDRLGRASDILAKRSAKPTRPAATRQQHGWLRRAILKTLAAASERMTPSQVHAMLEIEFPSRLVRYATVKSALADEVAKPTPRVQRCARGRYRLISSGAP